MADVIPSFFVYGEPDKPLDIGFMHVETVMQRKNVHQGHVKAHKHERMGQITFWTKGRGSYFVEDKALDFFAPAVSFVPSGVVHGFTVEPEETDAIVVSIADSALLPMQSQTLLPLDIATITLGNAGHPLWQRLASIMTLLADEYREARPGMDRALAALAVVAMTEIARLAQENPAATGTNPAALATDFRRLVDRHFRDNWPVERYIDALSTTPHLLAKACRNAFGLSVKEFISERRLLEAKRLLLFTVRSVEDIAYEIGLKEAAYFSRFFKASTGMPPSEWRAAHLQNPGN